MLTEALLKATESFPKHPLVNHPLTETFVRFLSQYQDNNPGFPPPEFYPDIEFLDDIWELYQRYLMQQLFIQQLELFPRGIWPPNSH